MDKKRLWSILLALPFAPGAFASTYISCDGCSMYQMANVAKIRGVGRYVVGDAIGNKVEALRVQSGAGHGTIPRVVNPQSTNLVEYDSLTAQEVEAFSSYTRYYRAAPVGYKKHFDLTIVPAGAAAALPKQTDHRDSSPGGQVAGPQNPGLAPMGSPAPGGGTVSYPKPGVNAYTFVNGGPEQNAFLAWVGDTATYDIGNLINDSTKAVSVFHITDSSVLPALSFTVTFTDGSHIGVYVDEEEQPPQLKVDPKSAVDSHGNSIPASASAITGDGRQNYDFSGHGNSSDAGNMHGQIGGFGVDLPATNRYACTSFPVKGGVQIHCVAY